MAAAKQAMPKYRQIEFVVKAYPNSKAAAPKYKNMLIMCLFIISPHSGIMNIFKNFIPQ